MNAQAEIQQLFMASTLHEAKNQLGQLMLMVDNLKAQAQLNAEADTAKQLDYQFQLLSFRLNQILQSYKQPSHHQLRLDYHELDDFFLEVSIRHHMIKDKITIIYDEDVSICHCFDESLMANVIDTFLYNALQAGAKTVHLSCQQDTTPDPSGLWITIEDDGPGFPQSLLNQSFTETKAGDLRQNKSGLGLYMAYQIIMAHSNHNTAAQMLIDNNSTLSGSRNPTDPNGYTTNCNTKNSARIRCFLP